MSDDIKKRITKWGPHTDREDSGVFLVNSVVPNNYGSPLTLKRELLQPETAKCIKATRLCLWARLMVKKQWLATKKLWNGLDVKSASNTKAVRRFSGL